MFVMVMAASASILIPPLLFRNGAMYPNVDGDYNGQVHSSGYNSGSGYNQNSGWNTDANINSAGHHHHYGNNNNYVVRMINYLKS